MSDKIFPYCHSAAVCNKTKNCAIGGKVQTLLYHQHLLLTFWKVYFLNNLHLCASWISFMNKDLGRESVPVSDLLMTNKFHTEEINFSSVDIEVLTVCALVFIAFPLLLSAIFQKGKLPRKSHVVTSFIQQLLLSTISI